LSVDVMVHLPPQSLHSVIFHA